MKNVIDRGATWKRIPEIYDSYKLFMGIDVDDVVQGELGDCYFISSITGVSEVPKRITKLFVVDKENEYGCYAVKLYICGSLQTIILDDYFPAYAKPGYVPQWAFTTSHDKEIWVMILEKAWAKAHGNYSRIIGGDSREALSALTGAPSLIINHSNMSKNDFWKILLESSNKKFVMCTGGAQSTKSLISGQSSKV